MPEILVENASIDFPIASARARSLKSVAVTQVSRVGGRIVKSETDVSVVRALDNISFHLRTGDRLGLFGANGAGKTTLIRMLAGIYTPTHGRVTIDGRPLPLFEIGSGFDDESTGYENIFIRGLVMGLTEEQIAAKLPDIAAFSELGVYLDFPIRTYSTGMLLRLMFSIATAVEGDIIFMDEWLTVGDQAFQAKAQERLTAMTKEIGILVLASQDPRTLRQFCDRVLTLEGGKAQCLGPADEVLPR